MPATSSLKLFFSNRMGVAGVGIIVFFTLMAVLAPYLTQNSPTQTFVSGPWAVPSWATVFPQYSKYPPNLEAVSQNISRWSVSDAGYATYMQVTLPSSYFTFSRYRPGPAEAIMVNASVPAGFFQQYVVLNASYRFSYNYVPPFYFTFGAAFDPIEVQNVTDLYLRFILVSPTGKVYHLTSYTLMSTSPSILINYRNGMALNKWNTVYLSSNIQQVAVAALGPSGAALPTPSLNIISQEGTYELIVQVVAITSSSPGRVSFMLSSPFLFIYGRQYGLLGTDNAGRDLWSQFVYGSRISIEVGLLASVVTVVVGLIVGLVAGLYSGWVDEVTMRITDIFLVIPFLPLAIIVLFILTQNAFLAKGLYFWLIILFAVLSWPSVARVIRSQVLSLKERGYIEAARALGANNRYIMWRHILPNVMGLVYANLALSVPGFILTEAALDFLFPGASQTPTWGRMLSKAFDHASVAAAYNYAWWWFIFPGLSIVLLSLAFVMVGYALDEVFNPRLRSQ